jgi:hypothetical protein
MSLDGTTPFLDAAGEISTFCPVRLFLAHRRFDGLLDTLDSKGGSFYVLTEGEVPKPGTRQREDLEMETRADLAFGPPEGELRIACRVRGLRIDEDGLFMYVGLDFLLGHGMDRRRLDQYIASLW